jgi:hypothetical protein
MCLRLALLLQKLLLLGLELGVDLGALGRLVAMHLGLIFVSVVST